MPHYHYQFRILNSQSNEIKMDVLPSEYQLMLMKDDLTTESATKQMYQYSLTQHFVKCIEILQMHLSLDALERKRGYVSLWQNAADYPGATQFKGFLNMSAEDRYQTERAYIKFSLPHSFSRAFFSHPMILNFFLGKKSFDKKFITKPGVRLLYEQINKFAQDWKETADNIKTGLYTTQQIQVLAEIELDEFFHLIENLAPYIKGIKKLECIKIKSDPVAEEKSDSKAPRIDWRKLNPDIKEVENQMLVQRSLLDNWKTMYANYPESSENNYFAFLFNLATDIKSLGRTKNNNLAIKVRLDYCQESKVLFLQAIVVLEMMLTRPKNQSKAEVFKSHLFKINKCIANIDRRIQKYEAKLELQV